ncbi:MAG TPA: glycosyltransferase family 2 protein [Chloroflexota bacterium]|nr:glycosyltransferase family 2 protein [Chloroflexota bacterium]HEX2988088.1 glycosyltransferase family 2 protein [Chloroflexota bacterium]
MLRDRLGQLEAVQTYTERVPKVTDRLWERVPGVVSWLVALSPIWVTLLSPILGLILVVAASVYFSARASWYGPKALINRHRVLKSQQDDWLARLEALEQDIPDWRNCRVTLMIRAYHEKNLDMLRATLDSIYASNWPKEQGKMVNVEVLYATEEDDPYTPPLVDKLAEEYADRVAIRQIKHPDEPNTLPGPSTAMNYTGRVLYREALRKGFPPNKWIVADFDADTLFDPQYIPCLVYHYVTDPKRDVRAYQPVVLFTTDYWKAPLHSRLSAIGTSVLTLGWIKKPEIAFTGAAASLATLHSVGFWPTNSHSQDSGVELRLRMQYGRNFKVRGLPIPLWVYPVMAMGAQSTLKERLRAYWRSYQALFRQSARWREGPLDEFAEATSRGKPWLAFKRLWNGLERDTLTLMPSYGLIVASAMVDPSELGATTDMLKSLFAIGLTVVSLLGLLVFWRVLGTDELVLGKRKPGQRIKELFLFWLVFSIYVPIFTSFAGLKTSTSYTLGKRPRGHFMPTPK